MIIAPIKICVSVDTRGNFSSRTRVTLVIASVRDSFDDFVIGLRENFGECITDFTRRLGDDLDRVVDINFIIGLIVVILVL